MQIIQRRIQPIKPNHLATVTVSGTTKPRRPTKRPFIVMYAHVCDAVSSEARRANAARPHLILSRRRLSPGPPRLSSRQARSSSGPTRAYSSSSTSSTVAACLWRGAVAAGAVAVDAPVDAAAGVGAGAGVAGAAAAAGGAATAAGAAAAAAGAFSFFERFSPTLRSFFFLGSSHAQRGMNESTWGEG